jgi:hypothetical protein
VMMFAFMLTFVKKNIHSYYVSGSLRHQRGIGGGGGL